ncbi:P2X purinoceptor 7-like [Ciona intestinalis]
MASRVGIEPYMFEPEYNEEELQIVQIMVEEEHRREHGDGSRLTELSCWCSCSNCSIQETAKECICCKECSKTLEMICSAKECDCITVHPGFSAVCLNKWSLDVAWNTYKQFYSTVQSSFMENAKYRHIAYRQYVRWIHGRIGRENRMILPSCVVTTIRKYFPPTTENV